MKSGGIVRVLPECPIRPLRFPPSRRGANYRQRPGCFSAFWSRNLQATRSIRFSSLGEFDLQLMSGNPVRKARTKLDDK